MADPGFPRGRGANSPRGRQHTILPHFPKNCMILKEFGPPGGGVSKILLYRSATVMSGASVINVIAIYVAARDGTISSFELFTNYITWNFSQSCMMYIKSPKVSYSLIYLHIKDLTNTRSMWKKSVNSDIQVAAEFSKIILTALLLSLNMALTNSQYKDDDEKTIQSLQSYLQFTAS